MTGRGSIRHNNRSFSAANVDRSRSGQNVTFCNEDLKKVYHELFDEALAAYNAKKKKTRDKIPDYYEHIRQSKQEKLFHEAIFQIGNLTDCGCGSPGGERAAAALKEFAESFQERNPHLRVFNMVLHMDEATPHLHVDFVPVATEQSRGLSTRVSMKQALKQQGFEGLGRKQTEWKAWMEREKEALTEIAQAHEFEIISLGGGRPHMELPEYRAAAQRLEAVQEQVIAAEQEIAALEKQRKALQGNVKLLKAVEKVKPDLDAIQPEKTLTGAVKGVTVEQRGILVLDVIADSLGLNRSLNAAVLRREGLRRGCDSALRSNAGALQRCGDSALTLKNNDRADGLAVRVGLFTILQLEFVLLNGGAQLALIRSRRGQLDIVCRGGRSHRDHAKNHDERQQQTQHAASCFLAHESFSFLVVHLCLKSGDQPLSTTICCSHYNPEQPIFQYSSLTIQQFLQKKVFPQTALRQLYRSLRAEPRSEALLR